MMKKGGFFDPFFMFKPFLNLANKRIGKGRIKRRLINRRRDKKQLWGLYFR